MATELLTLPDGRRLGPWLGGDRHGFPVVFLPGCPDSRLAALAGHEAAVRRGVRLVAVSRPGYAVRARTPRTTSRWRPTSRTRCGSWDSSAWRCSACRSA